MVTSRIVGAATIVATAALAGAAGARGGDVLPPPAPLPLPVLPQVGSSRSQSSSEASQREGKATSVAVAAQDARTLVVEINRVRRARKLPALKVSAQLSRAGTEHAKALALSGQFTHAWPDGSPFSAWVRRYYPAHGYRTWSVGENLVWQAPDLTARDAVRMWLASRPHRRNLLSRSWREVGLGAVRAQAAPGAYGGSDVEVAAAEFGRRSG
jgi:uncharacterized protein YkwD